MGTKIKALTDSTGARTLLNLWREGDQEAARQLVDRYTNRLLNLARGHISQRVKSRVDPEDIVQSVFRTFFAHARAGEFTIANQHELCKLLMQITVHKTLRLVAFHQAAKRDQRLEVGQGQKSRAAVLEVLDREPSPDAVAAFLDQLEQFLSRLRPQERAILEMRLQGYSNEEIVRKLGIYDRKIRRVIERIRCLAEQEGLGSAES
jgi:RNA polymerase sigma factor (sigma-70 family)